MSEQKRPLDQRVRGAFGIFSRGMRVLLGRPESGLDEGYRVIAIETNETWPSPEEMALRSVVEEAVAASGVAEVHGTDAGAGSVSVWVQLKRGANESG